MARLIERGFAAVGAMSFLACSLACMSFTIGGKTENVTPDEVGGRQHGKLQVAPGQEAVVYYPSPYMSPPNLEFDDANVTKTCQIVEQRPDGFRVRNTSVSTLDVGWQARGVKAATTAAFTIDRTQTPAVQPATNSILTTNATGP
jgi:hypothetical protein